MSEEYLKPTEGEPDDQPDLHNDDESVPDKQPDLHSDESVPLYQRVPLYQPGKKTVASTLTSGARRLASNARYYATSGAYRMYGPIKSQFGMTYSPDKIELELNRLIDWFRDNSVWNNPYSVGGIRQIFYSKPLKSGKFSNMFYYDFPENSCYEEHKDNLFGLFDPSLMIEKNETDYTLSKNGIEFITALNKECSENTTTSANIRDLLDKLLYIKPENPVNITLNILVKLYYAYLDIYNHINYYCVIDVIVPYPVILLQKRIVGKRELLANTSDLELDKERLCFKIDGGHGEGEDGGEG
jgi:hypothetical protein